jgi:hypothetical protein
MYSFGRSPEECVSFRFPENYQLFYTGKADSKLRHFDVKLYSIENKFNKDVL